MELIAGCCVLLVSYLGLNSALNLANKWGLSWFPYPLLLTCSHMAVSFVLLLPFMLVHSGPSSHQALVRSQWKGLLTIGIALGLNISLNNSSLVNMTLSLNQVIRAATPVFTCAFSMLIEKKQPSSKEGIALVILTIGVMTALWKSSAAGSFPAIVMCLTSTICNAGMMSMSGRMLSEDIGALQLAFYTSPVSFYAVLPVFIHYEMSAVTTTVVGQAKIIGLLLLSALLLGEKQVFSRNMIIGTVLSVLGFAMYSIFKLQKHHCDKDKLSQLASVEKGKMERNPSDSDDLIKATIEVQIETS